MNHTALTVFLNRLLRIGGSFIKIFDEFLLCRFQKVYGVSQHSGAKIVFLVLYFLLYILVTSGEVWRTT